MISNKIAVTGGSGHLGVALIQELLNQDFKVQALYKRNRAKLKHKNLSWIQGDITDKRAIDELIKESNIVVHCAAMVSIGTGQKKDIMSVNVTGTQVVVDACIKRGDIKLVHISSSNAVKELSKLEPFDENRPYKTKSDFTYSWSKALSEQKVLNAIDEGHLDAIIIRPTAVVGPPDYRPSLMGQTIKDLKEAAYPMISTGGYDMVDVRDLSQTIINSFSQGKQREIYLVGGNYCTIKELARMANNKKKPLVISTSLLLLFLPLVKAYLYVTKSNLPISKESLTTLKKSPINVDSTKAQKELNHETRPTKETVNNLLEWFTSNSRLNDY